jgi:hypothetical protein
VKNHSTTLGLLKHPNLTRKSSTQSEHMILDGIPLTMLLISDKIQKPEGLPFLEFEGQICWPAGLRPAPENFVKPWNKSYIGSRTLRPHLCRTYHVICLQFLQVQARISTRHVTANKTSAYETDYIVGMWITKAVLVFDVWGFVIWKLSQWYKLSQW